MNIFSVFHLFGGLAFFLYGMTIMSSGLEKMTGGKLEKGLKKVTSNRMKSLLFGAGVTIAIQSSSAMTVMLVGFVNSGIMELRQVIGIIMGSNIGTTLTAWVLSLAGVKGNNVFIQMLKPESFAPVVAIIGVLMIMIGRTRKKKDIGGILVGFSILMSGMTFMSEAVSPLADMPQFSSILTAFNNPLMGVIVGAVFTGVIQSSAASVGILQALSMTGNITYGMAIPIIMGQNIGTCMTALLSSIGVNKNAKRVAAVHIYFNVLGTIICLSVFYILDAVFHFSFITDAISPVGIAGVHSIFNLATTAILLPLSGVLEKLACITVKEKNSQEKKATNLDIRFLATPSVAIAECRESMIEMLSTVKESMLLSIELLSHYEEGKRRIIDKNEDITDSYEDSIGSYLIKLSGTGTSEEDSKIVTKILHMIGDVERIGDHAVNIAKAAGEIHKKEMIFSNEAQEEINDLLDALTQIMELSFVSYQNNDSVLAKKVEPLEQVIDLMCDRLKEAHVERLKQGQCTIEAGFVFNDLIANVQRVSDHCSNIAVCVLRVNESTFDTHEYLQKMKKTEDGQFMEDYLLFREKYVK